MINDNIIISPNSISDHRNLELYGIIHSLLYCSSVQSFSYLMGQLISIIVVVFCGHIGEYELAVAGIVCALVCV